MSLWMTVEWCMCVIETVVVIVVIELVLIYNDTEGLEIKCHTTFLSCDHHVIVATCWISWSRMVTRPFLVSRCTRMPVLISLLNNPPDTPTIVGRPSSRATTAE